MIKCEVIEKFDLKDFDKLSNIKRKSIDVKGSLFVGDTFECDEKMADYLTGNNALNKVVVKVVEIINNEYLKELQKVILETEVNNDVSQYEETTKKIAKDNLKSKKKKSSKK